MKIITMNDLDAFGLLVSVRLIYDWLIIEQLRLVYRNAAKNIAINPWDSILYTFEPKLDVNLPNRHKSLLSEIFIVKGLIFFLLLKLSNSMEKKG